MKALIFSRVQTFLSYELKIFMLFTEKKRAFSVYFFKGGTLFEFCLLCSELTIWVKRQRGKVREYYAILRCVYSKISLLRPLVRNVVSLVGQT